MNIHKAAKITLFAVPAITVMACASGGTGTSEKDKEGISGSKDGSAAEAKGDGKNQVGNWKIQTKNLQFKEEFGTFGSVKLKVKNTSTEDDEPWLSIRLTNAAGDLVTEYDCIGRTVEPGQSTVLDCTSLDDYAEWTDYKIANAF